MNLSDVVLRHPGKAIAAAILLPAAAWFLWAWYGIDLFARHWGNERLQALGQTGDLFGGINALFAAYAFAGVAVAAFFQYRSLRLLEEQHVTQAFEPLFFRLVELAGQLRPEKLVDVKQQPVPAPDATESIAGLLDRVTYTEWFKEHRHGPFEEKSRYLDKLYTAFYTSNEQALGPYFRCLYQLFRRIDESSLSEEQRVSYANIARATLGPVELFQIMVNCATPRGADFKPLVERYGLLKHLPRTGGGTHLEKIATQLAPILYRPTAMMGASERRAYQALRISIPGSTE